MAFSASASSSASAPATNHIFACPIAHTVLPHQFLCPCNGTNATQSLSRFTSSVSASAFAVKSMGVVMPGRRKLSSSLEYSCQASLSSSGIVDDASDVGDAVAAAPETLAKVLSIVARQLGTSEDAVSPDSKFQELGADSLDQVEIVMALEEEFDISVSENGAQSISTVQDAANVIQIAISEKPC